MQFHFHHSPLSYLKIPFLVSLLFLSLSRLKIGNPNLMPTYAPNELYLVRVAPEILFHVWIPTINFYVIESFQPKSCNLQANLEPWGISSCWVTGMALTRDIRVSRCKNSEFSRSGSLCLSGSPFWVFLTSSCGSRCCSCVWCCT